MIFAVTRQIFASRCSFVLVCVLNLVPGLGLDLVGGVDAQMIKLNRNLYQTKELIYRAGMQKKKDGEFAVQCRCTPVHCSHQKLASEPS